ncbi:hypothetical protein FQR65_LT17937 [Abscondita terminalis]|nr:hypothetical protein FQR65_LT17937 [Abscondita terminalis]
MPYGWQGARDEKFRAWLAARRLAGIGGGQAAVPASLYREVSNHPRALFAGRTGVSLASLWAMLGAADALSHAAVVGDISEDQARDELRLTLVAMVKRGQ